MSGRHLKASLVIGGMIDRSFNTALVDSQKRLRGLSTVLSSLKKSQKSLNIEMDNMREQGQAIEGVKKKYDSLKDVLDKTTKSQKALRKAEAFKGRMDRGNQLAQNLAGRATIGAAMGAGFLHSTLKESSAFQTETARLQVMGLPDEVKKQALEAGKSFKLFGTTTRENVATFNDTVAVLGNMKEANIVAPLLAKMGYANRVLYGTSDEDAARQQKDATRVIDLRGGASNSEDALKEANAMQQAVNATKGLITPTDFLHFMARAGSASKGLATEELYHGLLTPMIERGGDKFGTEFQMASNSFVQGHMQQRNLLNLANFGMVADWSKVKKDKMGNAAQANPGAIKGSDIFATRPSEWVSSILLPTLLKKKKITQQMYDHIFSGKTTEEEKQKLGIIWGMLGNNSTAAFIGDIVSNLAPMARDRKNADHAADVSGSVNIAKGTAKGQEQGVQAQLTNARLNLGQTILPTYISFLQKANKALEKFNAFTQDHPKLTKALMIGAVAVTGILAVSVPLLFAAGAAMSLYGNITAITARRQGFFAAEQAKAAQATIMGTEAETAAADLQATKGVGVFGRLKGGIAGVGGKIGGLFKGLAASLLGVSAPVAAVVVGLSVAAVVVWKYWEPLKAFFVGLGQGIAEGFAPIRPVFSAIGAWIQPVIAWFKTLLTPVHSSKKSLHGMAEAGKRVGECLGQVLTVGWKFFTLFTPIGSLFRIVIGLGKDLYDNWSSIMPVLEKVWDFLEKIMVKLTPLMNGMKSLFNFGDKTVGGVLDHPLEALKHAGASLGNMFGGASAAPVPKETPAHELPPIPDVRTISAHSGDTHTTNHITINQQPGQPAEDLVSLLQEKLMTRQPANAPYLNDGLIGAVH